MDQFPLEGVVAAIVGIITVIVWLVRLESKVMGVNQFIKSLLEVRETVARIEGKLDGMNGRRRYYPEKKD